MDPALHGRWNLVASKAGANVSHAVRFVFRTDHDELQGFLIAHGTAAEIPLPLCEAAGESLRVRLPSLGQSPVSDAVLVLSRIGDHFEGSWQDASGRAIGPPLDLLRVT